MRCIIAALCHGAFFGIGSVVAAELVAPDKRARAIAIMFTGLTAANVFGVPFGTFLGQQFGWRSTFWVISLIVTGIAFGGMFGAFTYIAYTLADVAGFADTAVPWLLVLFGVGLVEGNWVGGRPAPSRPSPPDCRAALRAARDPRCRPRPMPMREVSGAKAGLADERGWRAGAAVTAPA